VRATKLNAIGTTFVICLCCLIVLWARKRNVAGDEYARLNTGANITRGNSENGALPTREPKKLESKTTRQMTEPNTISNAIGYAKFYSRSHDAVIRVYDESGNVIETDEHDAHDRKIVAIV
jgi:hypothetical protein